MVIVEKVSKIFALRQAGFSNECFHSTMQFIFGVSAGHFGVDGLCCLWKAKFKPEDNWSNFTFYNLSTDRQFVGFHWKLRVYDFFFLEDNREGLEGTLSVIIMQNSLALYAQGTIGMTDTKDRDAILEGSLSCLTVLLVRVSLCTHCGFKEYDNFETVIN